MKKKIFSIFAVVAFSFAAGSALAQPAQPAGQNPAEAANKPLQPQSGAEPDAKKPDEKGQGSEAEQPDEQGSEAEQPGEQEPEAEPVGQEPVDYEEPPPDVEGFFDPDLADEPGEQGFVSDALPGDTPAVLPLYSGVHAPASPAFTLLGLSPGQIQKPSASAPLALTMARPLHSWDGNLIPLNLAVDLSPYWLASHPDLDIKGYVDSGFFAKLYQNMTLSLAASTAVGSTPAAGGSLAGLQGTVTVTSLAAAIRTGIDSRRHGCAQLDPLQDEYLEAVSREKLRAMDSAVAGGDQLDSFAPVNRDFKREWLRDRVRASALEQATRQCTRKRGFAVDVDFATAFAVPGQQFDDLELSALSTSLTFASLGDTVSVAPMLRFRNDLLDRDNARSVFDLGLQLSLAVQRFAFSTEFVYRLVTDKPADRRDDGYFVADLGVEVSLADGVWLNLTGGKDYADLTDNNLFVKTSLRVELGERTLRVDPEATGRPL